MASNFFQRWSERSLATKNNAESDLAPSHNTVIDSVECDLDAVLDVDSELEHSADPHAESIADLAPSTEVINEPIEAALTIDDVDNVTFDSGVASFLQQGVDKAVKRAALQKLFHADEFNYISDMDDHTEDFSNIPKLDSNIAKQLRGWINNLVEDDPELAEEQSLVGIDNDTTASDVMVDDEIDNAETGNSTGENKPSAIATITVPVTEDHHSTACCDDEKNEFAQTGGT